MANTKDTWDDYFIDGTDVLKNKLNITDKKKLEEKEKEMVLQKLAYLELDPIDGKFDEDHLKKIHTILFGNIYPFAGKYRTCTMAKVTEFYNPDMIEEELNKTLKFLNESVDNIFDKKKYAYVLAKVYYDLMVIHPFREGNGRSVREFLREFVNYYSYKLPFDLDYSQMDKDAFLMAVQQRYLYPSLLDMEFEKALVNINKEKSL